MAKIIAIANQKGGVAKTTTTQNLAVALAQKGKKVLMIDYDSQASLTIVTGLEPEQFENNCIVQAISEPDKKNTEYKPISECITKTPSGNVYLVPSIIDLADMEWQMFSRINRDSILKDALEPILDDFDFILIDCPPALGILTMNALACADGLLIPSSTEYLSYRGLKNLMRTIRQVKTSLNKNLQVLGVIATRHKRTTRNKQILEVTMQNFPVIAVVKELVEVMEGIYDGQAVVESLPNSEVSIAYKQVANMIINDQYPELKNWNWSDNKEENNQEK
ncbi:AAA family ATPase [Eubacteriales bacterium OttesenSCG-928-A19]|nr:AAA family ATPase [Eubacteriales bacterium OttesenSCG-928-A19]